MSQANINSTAKPAPARAGTTKLFRNATDKAIAVEMDWMGRDFMDASSIGARVPGRREKSAPTVARPRTTGQRTRSGPAGLDEPFEAPAPVRGPRRQNLLCAQPGEFNGYSTPDALTGTGDNGDLAAERLSHGKELRFRVLRFGVLGSRFEV